MKEHLRVALPAHAAECVRLRVSAVVRQGHDQLGIHDDGRDDDEGGDDAERPFDVLLIFMVLSICLHS